MILSDLEGSLFLVRHGETEWNSAGRYQGAKDSPLTARGRAQAQSAGKALAAWIKPETPVRAYVSPLGRARETASLIAQHAPLTIHIEPRIAEVSLGCWDGLSMDEIDAEYPNALTGAGPHDWYFRSPDGETFDTALARVSDWLHAARTPAIVITHGLTSRLIRGAYEKLSASKMLLLPVPQNGFYQLANGRSEFIESA
ncbi:MAG: histidine phosphatase family protein [Alphaproteobacteria bacterium]|nr:histidine phosphatase family protein [Alphaproteobacteria bacterium]